MEPEGMSDTMIISDHRSHITRQKYHRTHLLWVKFVMSSEDRSTVSLWDNRFLGGCVCIDSDPRPGRPRISADERSVKLVANALEEDHRARCEKHSRAMGAKNSQEKAHERPQLLVAGPFILHDNARPHTADVVTKKLGDNGWEVLPHVSYSPDTSPPDFDLFPS